MLHDGFAAVADGDAPAIAVDNRWRTRPELGSVSPPAGRVLIGTSSFFFAPGVCLPSGHDRWISKQRRGAPSRPNRNSQKAMTVLEGARRVLFIKSDYPWPLDGARSCERSTW